MHADLMTSRYKLPAGMHVLPEKLASKGSSFTQFNCVYFVTHESASVAFNGLALKFDISFPASFPISGNAKPHVQVRTMTKYRLQHPMIDETIGFVDLFLLKQKWQQKPDRKAKYILRDICDYMADLFAVDCAQLV